MLMEMEQIQHLLERQQSRADIMNLMGRYQYYHRRPDGQDRPGTVRLVAPPTPGANTARWGCSAQKNPWSSSTP